MIEVVSTVLVPERSDKRSQDTQCKKEYKYLELKLSHNGHFSHGLRAGTLKTDFCVCVRAGRFDLHST